MTPKLILQLTIAVECAVLIWEAAKLMLRPSYPVKGFYIWEVGDGEWWAAQTERAVIQEAVSEYGIEVDEVGARCLRRDEVERLLLHRSLPVGRTDTVTFLKGLHDLVYGEALGDDKRGRDSAHFFAGADW